mgnify:FL=1
MKNIYLFIISIIIISSSLNAQWVETSKPAPGGGVLCFWVTDTSLIAGAGHGIYNSTDNGDTWTELLPWTKLEFVNAFVAAPTESAGTNLFAGGLGGVYKSTNGGADWLAANSGLENKEVRSLTVSSDEFDGTTTLFAGTTTGVFRSSDNGTSWIESGLDSSDVYTLTVTKDETGESIILAGTEGTNNGTIFRSTDNGISWTASELFTYWTFCFDTNTDQAGVKNIFAGTYSGVYQSTDNGINWIHLDTGPNWSVHAFAFIPNGAGGINIFAGTFKGGVFLSTDNGESWSAVNTGLTYQDEAVVALAARGDYIFATTNFNGGVWRRSLSEIFTSVTSVENSGSVPSKFSLEQNYPNPFNPSTKISWQSPVGGHQSIKVYDVLGNEVATLINEEKPAGSYEVEFDASNLSSGVYLYKLQAGNFVETKKMIILR